MLKTRQPIENFWQKLMKNNWQPMTDEEVDWLQGCGPMPGH